MKFVEKILKQERTSFIDNGMSVGGRPRDTFDEQVCMYACECVYMYLIY